MRRTHVHPNVTRSTKSRGAQRSPELAFRSTDFRVPVKLIFLALSEAPQRKVEKNLVNFYFDTIF